MNLIFTAILTISAAIMLFTAPDKTLSVMLTGGTNAIDLSLKLLAVYAVWLSVLKLTERLELDKKIAKLFSPIIDRLFKGESAAAKSYITINLASNMLGMGGAATPAGIKAMQAMYQGDGVASDNMLLLLVLNATSVQLIPATVIALRSAAGSSSAGDIILPALISTACSTLIGAVAAKIISKFKRRKARGRKKQTANTAANTAVNPLLSAAKLPVLNKKNRYKR
ncbi:MAG: hypothetical protein LBT55_00760 [Clostridiaceae bacterium]|nr:hypothetical protein [Clostridiaceae bacterium]